MLEKSRFNNRQHIIAELFLMVFDLLGNIMYNFDLPQGALVTADKAYNDYAFEDLMEEARIEFQPLRGKNSKRPIPAWVNYMLPCYRKVIETTGSLLEQLLPKHIHTGTAHVFELKVAIFVLATSFKFFKVVN